MDALAVVLPLVGFFAGLCGGLLGIGGSIVMIPAMTELMGPKQHLFQAAALIVNFFVAAPAVVQHARAGGIDRAFVGKLVPVAAVSAVAGVAFSEWSAFRGGGSIRLTGLFGVFLFYVAAREVHRLAYSACVAGGGEGVPRSSTRWYSVLVVGIPTGFVSGLLGVGGGVVAVPLQRRVLGTDLRLAIANSAAMIVGLSVVGALAKHWALVRNHPEYGWPEPAGLAILLIPTAILGSWLGGWLTHRLPLRAVRVAFVVLLVVAGGRMVWRGIVMHVG